MSTLKLVGWALISVPFLITAYEAYQYLYFSGVISTPLLSPSLAAEQPSHPEEYAVNTVIAAVFAATLLGLILYGRHREKRARGFEVVKRACGGPDTV